MEIYIKLYFFQYSGSFDTFSKILTPFSIHTNNRYVLLDSIVLATSYTPGTTDVLILAKNKLQKFYLSKHTGVVL